MGAGAQIGELALLVEGDVGVLRQIMDQLHLVGLALLLHELEGLFRGSSKRSSFSFSLQILRISPSSFSRISGVKGKGESMS